MDEYGVKYSKDGQKLLKAPKEFYGSYTIKQGTKVVCDNAFLWMLSFDRYKDTEKY